MKVYSITQESECDGWVGTQVFASIDTAMATMNRRIADHNEHNEEKQNQIIWPERRGYWTFDMGPYRFHFDSHNLEK